MNVHSVMPGKRAVPRRWAAYVQSHVGIITGGEPAENPLSRVVSALLFCISDDLS